MKHSGRCAQLVLGKELASCVRQISLHHTVTSGRVAPNRINVRTPEPCRVICRCQQTKPNKAKRMDRALKEVAKENNAHACLLHLGFPSSALTSWLFLLLLGEPATSFSVSSFHSLQLLRISERTQSTISHLPPNGLVKDGGALSLLRRGSNRHTSANLHDDVFF